MDTRFLFAVLVLLNIPASELRAEAHYSDAVNVFHCTFGGSWDEDFDRWPDRWVRKAGLEYPHYVNIAIQDDSTAAGGKCLRIDLDGAAAAVSSPPIRVMSRYSYVFEASLKNEGLKHSVVVVTLDFWDSTGRVLVTESKTLATTKGWEKISIGPLGPSDQNMDRVSISLRVVRGSKGDLHGRVSLADVWFARLPRIDISTDNPCHVYTELNDVEVKCELTGIRERDPEIRFQLLDALNQVRDSHKQRLNGRLIEDEAQQASEIKDGVGQGPNGYEGSATWPPKIADYGLYRVIVNMLSHESSSGQKNVERKLGDHTVWLAVVPPLAMPKQGEFGWTLPQGDHPLPFQELSRLLPQVGINWVKVPLWFEASDPRRGDDLIRFVELMGASNIEAVGIIDRPPPNSDLASRMERDLPIAELLLSSSIPWAASLEPVMTRLSLRVRWWQLGRDDDTSFTGQTDLVKRIEELRRLLFRFGQDVRLGLCWNWEQGNEIPGNVGWDFEQLRLETQPSDKQFDELLTTPRKNSAQHWIVIEPPPRLTGEEQFDEAAHAARASEFVRRLVLAKVRGADGIIVTNPFDDEHGLMHSNGMPAEMLLPWRTTAAMLGGAEYIGQMRLPGGSENRIFVRPDRQVVMVVWNRRPTREVLYLGDDVQHVDLDGRTSVPTESGNEQIIAVGPQPAFVLGLHEAITRWRMSAVFERSQVPSIYSKPHANALKFKNFFPQGVGGSFKIIVPQEQRADTRASKEDRPKTPAGFVPDRWTIEPPKGVFALARDEEARLPFDIRLKDAYFGNQPIRVDFNIQADEPRQFSVHTEMEVGTAELTLDVSSHIDKDGNLIVVQLMTNKAERLADFRCYLFGVPGQRPQRMQVYRLGPNLDRKVYRLPNGRALVGRELWLEIEELNGPRVLRYRFVATAKAPEKQ